MYEEYTVNLFMSSAMRSQVHLVVGLLVAVLLAHILRGHLKSWTGRPAFVDRAVDFVITYGTGFALLVLLRLPLIGLSVEVPDPAADVFFSNFTLNLTG